MAEARTRAPLPDNASEGPGDPSRLTLDQLLEHDALGPADRLPTRYRGPRSVTGDGWMGFATRLERGEELALIRSLTAANRRVLDVGGGIGEMARTVAARTGSCTAIEPHPQLVDAIRDETTRGVVDVHPGTAEEIPFPDGSFDAVYSAWVLQYVNDVERAVAEMVRVCDRSDPESKIVLFAAGSDNELMRLVNEVCVPIAEEPYDHHGYLLSQAARALAARGFDDFSLHRAESSIRFDGEEPAERAAIAAAVLTGFWYERHPRAEEIRSSLESALARHFALRPHAIGDQAAVLVARPGSRPR
ncbi:MULTISPECIES: class I SAM-dependent methyltransferase [Nocardiopsis]|uniref:class I SAM-dependent methyltransferase n=1 Tax=Nocardiopsis TaxID=2013 RepID=UPI0003AAF8F4|nr:MULTISPECIES: class I SAM-dependent methyltransferase [Nocardiopsis]ASU58908.1 methyltransferase type 11 [Nocardiopsis dassonvillei]